MKKKLVHLVILLALIVVLLYRLLKSHKDNNDQPKDLQDNGDE